MATLLTTEDIRKHIRNLKSEAKKNGQDSIVLISGDIHKDLGLENRMPSVCDAMYSLMNTHDIIMHTTPSGKSSTIKIKYFL